MNFLKHIRIVILLLITLSLSASARTIFASEIFIIVHPKVTETTLDREALRDIYLGDKTTWGNGSKIRLSILRKGDAHKKFLKKYIDKAPSIYIRYWKRQILTGKKATLPILKNTEKSIVDFVSNTEGSIGYVSSDCPINNLKTIKIIE